jgi:peptide/nickel transport system substrate-binding protein
LAACSDDDEPGGNGEGQQGQPVGADRQGSEVDPLPAPGSFNEAPMLAELVEAGELPPVEERMPTNPYVVPHRWLEIGNYGGNMRMSTDDSTSNALKEYSYGRSFLRYLNDGLDIGPGMVESWESNDDASEWVLHFREGLKWSDGEPWTTADVLYWWEDLVNNSDHPEGVPDDVRSGRDTVAEITAPDDHTLVLTFDAPAPVTPERLAAWVNQFEVGPLWHLPRHYMEQFHPDYNDAIDDEAWFETHDQHADHFVNPECPSMAGWIVVDYAEGSRVVLERNPYCYVVDREGNQLPMIETDRVATNLKPEFVQERLARPCDLVLANPAPRAAPAWQ